MLDPVSKTFLQALRERDPERYRRGELQAVLGVAVGERLGWPDDRLDRVRNTFYVDVFLREGVDLDFLPLEIVDRVWPEDESAALTDNYFDSEAEFVFHGVRCLADESEEPDWAAFPREVAEAFAAVRPLIQPIGG